MVIITRHLLQLDRLLCGEDDDDNESDGEKSNGDPEHLRRRARLDLLNMVRRTAHPRVLG